MCFSAEASYTTAALLLPAGVVSVTKAYRSNCRYLAICALPFLFGLQQLFEGMVWTAGAAHDNVALASYSLAYMFFSWLAWPVWVPAATFFLEPARRKPLYLAFTIIGALFGGAEYFSYFAHKGWLTVSFLPYAIVYGGTETLDFLASRYVTYAVYLVAVVLPLLVASKGEIRIFGILIAVVLVITFSLLFWWRINVTLSCWNDFLGQQTAFTCQHI